MTTEARGAARRSRRGIGRSVVASALAGVLVTGALLGYGFTSANSADDGLTEAQSSNTAIPEAAADSAEQGFTDRSEETSRNAVRIALTSGVADSNADERDASIEDSATNATESEAQAAAEERDRLMAKDMELVAAQADKLEAEAKAAEKRLAEAKEAAEAAGLDTDSMSEEELAELSDDMAAAATSGGGSMPVKSNYRVGASFGQTGSWSRYHTGQDFPAPVGTPIYAASSGIVLSPTAGGWAGTNVVIQHGGNGATLYAHMSSKVVSTGQAVKAGQLIGYVGMSGRSYGPHLHFEYYPAGTTPGDVYSATNPMTFLRSLGVNV
ncbi:MAG: M23 family metallopeptidase [Arachnia sp.]